jgi:hypothetical protein
MKIKQSIYNDYQCIQLSNPSISLWLSEDFGPRIIALSIDGGGNLFAELPDARIECPGSGWYSLRGGHRLWYAPEYPPITYLPDDEPVEIQEIKDGIGVTQHPEKDTGLVKSITVTLPCDDPHILLDHQITNLGMRPIQLAPWTITMMRPGGTAIMPLQVEKEDEYGVLPNRTINIWPYTPLNSPHLNFNDRYIFIEARLQEGKLKIGCPNPRGWLGYALEGCLFVKFAAFDPSGYYYDRRSSCEFYCDPNVLEVEALDKRVSLEPGQSVNFLEEWKVFPGISIKPDQELVDKIVADLGLES